MKNFGLFYFLLIFSVFSVESKSPLFRYKLKTGSYLEILNFADQKIRDDKNQFERKAANRILLQVKKQDPEKGYLMNGDFASRFKYKGGRGLYQEEESWHSSFYIHPLGMFNVPANEYMPNLRSIPTFPEDKDPSGTPQVMKTGDTWEAPGEEVFLFEKLLPIPLTVRYEYRGVSNLHTPDGDKILHKILINYEISREFEVSKGMPKSLYGFATAVLLWDEQAGVPYFMQDEYTIVISFPDGKSREFRIRSKAYYRVFEPVLTDKNTDDVVSKLKNEIKKLPEKNRPEIKKTENGIRIDLPDVLFEWNSSKINSDSETLLKNISKSLKQLGKVQILVRGHTDNTGTENYNQQLSTDRARQVADYLQKKSEIPPDRISFRGYGSSKPVASNRNPEGRKKNRRVEIWITE